MANDYFNFRQFTVRQERCAMKVGTDGTLLGAWAHGGSSILDIGVGTGLIALMMAQRFPESHIVGIDIDHEAVEQALENVKASPFRNIDVVEADAKSYGGSSFDAIVCNPPYFADSLQSPDMQRTIARHTVSLSFPVCLTITSYISSRIRRIFLAWIAISEAWPSYPPRGWWIITSEWGSA